MPEAIRFLRKDRLRRVRLNLQAPDTLHRREKLCSMVLQRSPYRQKQLLHDVFVRDDAIELAFCTCMNDLICAHWVLLKPYVDDLEDFTSDESLRREQELAIILERPPAFCGKGRGPDGLFR